MVIEAATGSLVGFLLGRLEKKAESIDAKDAIKDALIESVEGPIKAFRKKYPDFSKSFLTKPVLENHVAPEILKILTRNENPDSESVAKALPDHVVFSDESEINEFFGMVMDSMKKYDVLQDLINNRQIDETNQDVKDIQKNQKAITKLLEDSFNNISFQQEETDRKTDQIVTQSAENTQQLDQILNLLNDKLPSSRGNDLNKFLTKQLDRARDLINSGQVNDAQSLLVSMEDEVSESDDYTRFRWHTNLGACLLSHDNRQEAAEQYLTAYNFAKNEEKAVANRIRAFLLMGKLEEGLERSEKAIVAFPESGIIWALHINAKNLLNIEFDETLLPDNLQQDTSVLLSLSDLKFQKKIYEESYELARKAFEQDETSNDAKRAMLASALSWATADSVKSHYRQISTQQHRALRTTVDSFGDIIPFLKNIQSKYVFTEVAHNLAVASELLGQHQLKKEITTYAFSEYPGEAAFIWYRIKDLKESGNIDAIHKLTDDKLEAFDKPLLFTIAEIGANTGDIQWVNSVSQCLNSKSLDKYEKDELFGLELCSIWKGGDKSAAIKLAKSNLSRITSYPSLLSFYIRMLDEYGEFDERDKLLQYCTKLPEELSSIDIIQIADLLYDFNFYYDAAALYQRLIESPSDDYLTKRYLDSLIKSGQRAKCLAVLEQLPDETRGASSFKRIEANLARASGDLDKLEKILSEELDANPSDSFVAVGYIATLYHKGKLEELNEYLKAKPTFDPVIEQNEIEIAKYQMELGHEYDALLRVYSLFRAKPGNSELAGYFLLLMLQAKNFDQLKGLNVVSASTVIYLESNGENKKIVIEPASLTDGGWPECISEQSDVAKSLLGKNVGDKVTIEGGLTSKQWHLVGIDSMFIFASNIAHNVVANSASSIGPLWSVNVRKSDGEFDFSPILETLKHRTQHVEHVFSVYEDKKLPLQMLANALGTDLVTLVLEWPYKNYDLFVCTGTHEEREEIKNQISNGDKPYVVDLSCLIELQRIGLLKESIQVLGKPLISASSKEYLLGIIQSHNKMEPSGIASEIDGQLQYQDIPQSYLDERGRILNELLEFIDDHCEVVPVIGPEIVTEEQVALEQYIGLTSNDTILLALERNAILVSEDGGFRSLATSMGVTSSSWLQPLLMILRDKKIISESQYSKSILNKLKRRHNFTSVAANDLLWAAKSCPNTISFDVELAIETFRSTTLDLASGVVVGSLFLRRAAECISPGSLLKYYNLIIKSLSYERDDYANDIHESLRFHIVSAFPQIKQNKVKLITRKFGHLLDPPPPRHSRIRQKPLAHAIRLALRN